MIELHRNEGDSADFINLVARLIAGCIRRVEPAAIYITHVDNWFDHKWLGFSGGDESRRGEIRAHDLRIPPFVPNRVLNEALLVPVSPAALESVSIPYPLHRAQPGDWAASRNLRDLRAKAALFWYSGSSNTNERGSLMAYLPAGESYWCWYASFGGASWRASKLVQITREELAGLEQLAA